MKGLHVLWDETTTTPVEPVARKDARRLGQPQSLVDFYGGPLAIPLHAERPTVVVNFVTTLDGLVSFGEPGAMGGSHISGASGPDRRLMALLRTMADAVLVGAGTVRVARAHGWSPRDIDGAHADDHAAARVALGLTPQPMTVVASASGDLDAGQSGLSRPDVPVLVATTSAGAARLEGTARVGQFTVMALGDDDVDPASLLAELQQRHVRLVVCEGGPHLFGRFLAAGFVDELFLTLAPQLAGRKTEQPRLSLVEGLAFAPALAPWGRLISVRRAGSHLFLRYRFTDAETAAQRETP